MEIRCNSRKGGSISRDMFSDNYRKPHFLVAKHKDQIIGSVCITEELFTIDVFGLSWVGVHPSYTNKGIGTSMIRKALATIKSNANRPVTVILATYPEKTRLYEKVGFKRCGKDHDGGSFMTYHIL